MCAPDQVIVAHSPPLLPNSLFCLNIPQFIDGCWSYCQFHVFTNNDTMQVLGLIPCPKAESLGCHADHFGHRCNMGVPS